MKQSGKNAGRLTAQLSAMALALGSVAPMAGCSSEQGDESSADSQKTASERPANPCAGATGQRPSNPCAGG